MSDDDQPILKQAVWQNMIVDIDVIRCKQQQTEDRPDPPSAAATERIAVVLANWPVDVCRIVSEYITYCQHTWNVPPAGWRDLSTSSSAVSVGMTGAYPFNLPWYRCVSNQTLRTGRRRWTINCENAMDHSETAAVGDQIGWIAFGVVDDNDSRPIRIHPGSWYDAVCAGFPSYWISRNEGVGLVAWQNDLYKQKQEAVGLSSVRRCITFEADDQTLQITAIVGFGRFVIADLSADAEQFYRMRPAVVMSGRMAATMVNEADDDDYFLRSKRHV